MLPAQEAGKGASHSQAADSISLQSNTDIYDPHSKRNTSATGMESSSQGMRYDYNQFDQAADQHLLVLASNAAAQSVPFGSDFALPGSIASAEPGYRSGSDLWEDKQNLNSCLDSEIPPTEANSSRADRTFSAGLEQHSSIPADLRHGWPVNSNQGPKVMEGSVASSSDDISVSGHPHSHRDNVASRTQASAGFITPISTCSSRQRTPDSPVSVADYTRTCQKTKTKPSSVTSSIKSGTVPSGSSADKSETMALPVDAPVFRPTFNMPTPLSAISPRPRFLIPTFSTNFRQPSQPRFPPVSEDRKNDLPAARVFGLQRPPHPGQADFNRFVGPNLYPPSDLPFSVLGKNGGPRGSLNFSAAARSPVPKTMPPGPSGFHCSKKSPNVEKIELQILNGCKLLVLMRGLPGSGKSQLARYVHTLSMSDQSQCYNRCR